MRTSVFFFVYKILLSIYAQIYNSSPTYRGRRILAIYYVKVCNSNHPSTLQFFNAPKLARQDLSGTMCIQKLMPSGFFLFLHAFNMRIYIDCQNTIVDCTRNIFFHISRQNCFFGILHILPPVLIYFCLLCSIQKTPFPPVLRKDKRRHKKSSPFKAAFFMPSFYRYHSIIHGILCQYYLDCNSVAYYKSLCVPVRASVSTRTSSSMR